MSTCRQILSTLIIVAAGTVAIADTPLTGPVLPYMMPDFSQASFGVRYSLSTSILQKIEGDGTEESKLAIVPAGEWVFVLGEGGDLRYDYTLKTTDADGVPCDPDLAEPFRRRSLSRIGSTVVARDLQFVGEQWAPVPVVEVGLDPSDLLDEGKFLSSYPMLTYADNASPEGVSGLRWLSDLKTLPVHSVTSSRTANTVIWKTSHEGVALTYSLVVDESGVIRKFSKLAEFDGVSSERINEIKEVRIIDGYQVPWRIQQTFRMMGVPSHTVTATVEEFHFGEAAQEESLALTLPEPEEVQEVNRTTGESIQRSGKSTEQYLMAENQ